MAYDYAERLCDFRPNDFATFRRGSATLTELPISPRGRRLFFSPADRRRVPPGRRGRCRGFRPDLKAETFFSPLYCIVQKSVVFQTVASANKKLDKISIKHLTINKTLDILKSSIKHLIPIDEGSFNNAEK
jgi:hypothetical protein